MSSLNSQTAAPARSQTARARPSRPSATARSSTQVTGAIFTRPLDGLAPARGAKPLASPAPSRGHWLDPLKRWSPAFLPPVVGLLLLLIALFFASQRGIVGAPTIAPTTLIVLVAVYLILGVVWGICLYFATDTLHWLIFVLAGAAAYTLATAVVYWGVVGTAVVASLFLWLLVWYGRGHRRSVPANTIAFTSLAGARLRDLTPGSWLLAPGERVLKVSPLHEQTFVCGPVEVQVQSVGGRHMIARSAAVIAYRLWRKSAFQAEFFPEDWARRLRESAEDALKLALEDWAQSPQPANPESPASQLAKLFRRAFRDAPDLLDLRINSVQVQEVSLEVDHRSAAPAARPAPTPPASFARATTPVWSQSHAVPPMPLSPAPSPANNAPPPPMPDVLDPTVLTEAYQAVAEQRITDPATIRAIAEAFAALAHDRHRSEELDFDAEAAARILLHHAAKLEGRKN